MITLVASATLLLALAGCRPEPGPTPAPTSTVADTPTPTPTSTPTETSEPAPLGPDDISLPADCESIYTADALAALEATMPPLNDPGVTLLSSQIVEALELLDSGIPTLRCSWGAAGESGIATNVSIVAQDQVQELVVALQSVGFVCDSADDGTLCSLDRTTIDADSNEVRLGEAHFFRGNGWVSTAWIGDLPAGYVDSIAQSLWT